MRPLDDAVLAELKARTVHGDRAVAEVRASGEAADPLEQVAVHGLDAYPDKVLAVQQSVVRWRRRHFLMSVVEGP